MFIPFGPPDSFINPAQISRMVYKPGKRLTLVMSDGQAVEMTVGAIPLVSAEDVDAAYKTVRLALATSVTFRGVPVQTMPLGEAVDLAASPRNPLTHYDPGDRMTIDRATGSAVVTASPEADMGRETIPPLLKPKRGKK